MPPIELQCISYGAPSAIAEILKQIAIAASRVVAIAFVVLSLAPSSAWRPFSVG